MGFPLTLPQAPVVVGQSGHLNDHGNIQADLSSLWSAAWQSTFNVKAPPYNAAGNGTTDDTTAVQNAINAANTAGGGVVYFPAGTYKLTPASSTSAALVLNNGTTGFAGVRLVGASAQATVLKKNGNGPLIAMAGPSTDLTGATHCRYCSLENMTVDGGNNTGLLVQAYYADDLLFRDVHFQNNNDAGIQSAEFWDSRFVNCVWDSLGSTTANTTAPAVWLCNTVAASGFGASTDVVNQIYFWGCRWEANKSGGLRIERGPGGGTGQPAGIFVTDCKMESLSINGGNFLYVDVNSQFIDVQHLYCYAGGFYSGYSTAQDVISFSPQVGSLRDIRIFNASANAVIANGITVNSPLSGGLVSLENSRGKYTTAPTGVHVNIGTTTGLIALDDNTSDNGTLYSGALAGTVRKALITGTTSYFIKQDGTQAFGGGGVGIDASLNRAGAGLLYAGANFEVSGYFQSDGLAKINAGSTTAVSAPVLTPSFANGAAAQLSDTTRDYMVYLTIGTAGTANTLAIGPTSTPANTLINSATATSGEIMAFRLPAGWWVKWSATTATLATQTAIGC